MHNTPVIPSNNFSITSFSGLTFAKDGASDFREIDPQRGYNPYTSRIISVVGLRLGDEGKGRTVEEIGVDLTRLTGDESPIALMLKANGGANSGHTVYDEAGNKYAFNLIPAGVVNKSIPYLALGAQVVADPLKIIWEGKPLELAGFDLWKRLVIDERTMISDIGHRIRDLAREMTRAVPVGSTGRGIAPAYEDMGAKDHLPFRMFLGDKETFVKAMRERLQRCCDRVQYEYKLPPEQWEKIFDYVPPKGSEENPGLKQRELRANAQAIEKGIFSENDFDFTRFLVKHEVEVNGCKQLQTKPFAFDIDAIIETYWEAGQQIKNSIGNVGDLILKIMDTTQKSIIAEHGQAIGLDVVHGDIPFTTSSNTTASIVPHSARSRSTYSTHVVLVCKAYETAVGTHSLPCQLETDHPLAQILLPQEKGATTGRQRWVSWPCAVQMGEALRWHGAHDFVINKIDQLTYKGDWQEPLKLKICIAYKTPAGEVITRMPQDSKQRRSLEPIYIDLPGWSEDICGARSFDELPLNAQRYIATLYAATVNIANAGLVSESQKQFPLVPMIGVGPKPGEVVRNVPLASRLLSLAYSYELVGGGARLVYDSPVSSMNNSSPSSLAFSCFNLVVGKS